MFYKPISLREAVENVNKTWFLPAVQRPYDWGARHRKEEFIYRLFDSIVREYPIGTLILWETGKRIPFRPFLNDYHSEKLTKIMEEGVWGRKDKSLIYDGQQRLQSIFSCLKFTFHNNVLCYDLLFDRNSDKRPKGFKFFEKHSETEAGFIKLNEIYSCKRRQLAEFEDKTINKLRKSLGNLSKKQELIAKDNLKQLWKLLVERDTKLLSYYPLLTDLDEKEVLDVFKRINTTGMQLTNSEILFSEIKRVQFDFEEQIWEANLKIRKETNGFSFSPDNTLQILFLLVKGAVRVDPERVTESELKEFVATWSELEAPLRSFFYDFLYREFRITHERIIRVKRALTPLIVYFYYMRKFHNHKFKNFSASSIRTMKKYLIYSQLLYWDLQAYSDGFHRIIKKVCKKTNSAFPFQRLRNFVREYGRRRIDLTSEDVDYPPQRWFVLKILTPKRQFSFLGDPDERFNPEIDHIFPEKPAPERTLSKKYQRWIDTVWNLQPVKGEINNLKRRKLPRQFFSKHPQYLKDYDFLPTTSLNERKWSYRYASEFIKSRKAKMLKFVRKHYGINVKP